MSATLIFNCAAISTGTHDEAVREGPKNLVAYKEDGVTPKVKSTPAEGARFQLDVDGEKHEGIEFTKGQALGGMSISRQLEQHFIVGKKYRVTIEQLEE